MNVKLIICCWMAALSCFAQAPLTTGSGIAWFKLASAASGPTALMPNLAEYWEFTDTTHVLTTNAAVTNWIGKLQGTVLTNGASSLRPTNSASGVGFSGTQVLTNLNFGIGSNWTVTVFVQYTLNNLGNFAGTLCGSNNINNDHHNFSILWASGGANKYAASFTAGPDQNGLVLGQSGNLLIPSGIEDFTLSNSNNANGGSGRSYMWTNGVNLTLGSVSAMLGINQFISYVGTGDGGGWGPGQFGGYIQGIYIQTNFVPTSAQASNIHYYRTNIFTPGAAP